MSIRDNYRTVQWNSSRSGFHLKIDAFFIIHVLTIGLDLILYWKTHNYQKVILLNLKMLWCAWWPIFLLLVLFKIYFKSSILRFEILSGKTLSVIPAFTALILLLLFQIIKIRQCCGFTFTNFFCFLTTTNALANSWVTFSNASVFFVFFLLSDLIFPW